MYRFGGVVWLRLIPTPRRRFDMTVGRQDADVAHQHHHGERKNTPPGHEEAGSRQPHWKKLYTVPYCRQEKTQRRAPGPARTRCPMMACARKHQAEAASRTALFRTAPRIGSPLPRPARFQGAMASWPFRGQVRPAPTEWPSPLDPSERNYSGLCNTRRPPGRCANTRPSGPLPSMPPDARADRPDRGRNVHRALQNFELGGVVKDRARAGGSLTGPDRAVGLAAQPQ